MIDFEKESSINSVLHQLQRNEINIKKANHLIQVILGFRNTASCKLDRLPKNCCIFQDGKLNNCINCGHNY